MPTKNENSQSETNENNIHSCNKYKMKMFVIRMKISFKWIFTFELLPIQIKMLKLQTCNNTIDIVYI